MGTDCRFTQVVVYFPDSSPKWKLLPSNKRTELQGNVQEDGEFWMSFEDFCKNFTDFEVCSVSIDQLYEDDAGTYACMLRNCIVRIVCL